jgi:DNA adenine methylase
MIETGTRGRDTIRGNALPLPKPFLKWTGGKQWLALLLGRELEPYVGRRYFEPFLGGGAIFFAAHPPSARLSDSNADLIAAYRAVRDHVDEVIHRLAPMKNDFATFHKVRSSRPTGLVERAIRVIYLNKTAYNGIYRVNQDGQFNVPYGRRPDATVCQEPRLRAASAALQGVTLRTADYKIALREVQTGDFIYLDPPYITTHNNNGFIKYNARLFSWGDQLTLAAWAEALVECGARVMVSNAAHKSVVALYPSFRAIELRRHSLIGGLPQSRGDVSEVLLSSFDVEI